MLLLALITLAAVGILLYLSSDFMDRVSAIFLGLMLGSVIGFLFAFLIGLVLPTHFEANDPVYLHNLYDNPEINGRFFLGSGYVDSTETLHYSYLDEEGFIVFAHLDKESVRVTEDNPEVPYLITYDSVYDQEWFYLIGIHTRRFKAPEFHIPEGTIDNSYSIR